MKKDNSVYLKQIADYIDEVEGYIKGVSFNKFEKNGLLQDGVTRK